MKNTQNSFWKNSRYEIRLAGSGGQGIILAGIILAEAAVRDGRYVAHSQNYGPETRGGVSISDVILSNTEIDYPQALALDLLVALTPEACQRNLPKMKDSGFVIVDSDLVSGVPWPKVASLPLREIAQRAGEPRAINTAALAAVSVFCPLVSFRSLTKILAERLPQTKVALNLSVFNEARKAARDLKASLKLIGNKDELEI